MNEILNRLEKTKLEKFPDLAAEKEGRDREERNEKKAQIQEMKRKEKEEMKKKREMDELRYTGLGPCSSLGFSPRVLRRRPPGLEATQKLGVLTELFKVLCLCGKSPCYRGVGCE